MYSACKLQLYENGECAVVTLLARARSEHLHESDWIQSSRKTTVGLGRFAKVFSS